MNECVKNNFADVTVIYLLQNHQQVNQNHITHNQKHLEFNNFF